MTTTPQTPAPPLRCPACGAPVDAARLRPGQMTIACAYCGTPVPVAPTLAPRLLIWLSSGGKWLQGGWMGDPRVWGIFVLLALGLVALLVFGDFGPR